MNRPTTRPGEPPADYLCMVCGGRETCEPCTTANRGDTQAAGVRLTWPPGVVEQTLFDNIPHHTERH